eukprot:3876760-Pyramimonas_sp.AAC.1
MHTFQLNSPDASCLNFARFYYLSVAPTRASLSVGSTQYARMRSRTEAAFLGLDTDMQRP